MNLGSIMGKTTTLDFKFKVEKSAKKFQYLRVPFKNGNVLAQIIEMWPSLTESKRKAIVTLVRG